MPSRSTCTDEIETLHAFFVDWYAGTVDEDAFDRMERAIAPGFELVTPDGLRRDRSDVLEDVRESYGRDEPGEFEIDIRNVEVIHQSGAYATVRYEEWQESADETTGRVSTVLFGEDTDTPDELIWIDLHETWIDRGDDHDS